MNKQIRRDRLLPESWLSCGIRGVCQGLCKRRPDLRAYTEDETRAQPEMGA